MQCRLPFSDGWPMCTSYSGFVSVSVLTSTSSLANGLPPELLVGVHGAVDGVLLLWKTLLLGEARDGLVDGLQTLDAGTAPAAVPPLTLVAAPGLVQRDTQLECPVGDVGLRLVHVR